MTIQVALIKNKRHNDFMTDAEVSTLWQYSKKFSPQMPIFLGHAIFRGMRNGEICAINLKDYAGSDFDRMNIIFEKTHIQDEFPILKEFSMLIKEYIKNNMHRFKEGWIFPSNNPHEHIKPITVDIYFGRLRSIIGKDHPEFLEKRSYRPSHWILCNKIKDGVKDLEDLRKRSGIHKETLRKSVTRLFELGYVDLELQLTEKGQAYIRKDIWHHRFRITMHTLRRWFETKLHDKYKDSYLVRDIMRYLDVKTVNHYIDSYKTWLVEKEIMKETFQEIYKQFEQQGKGQVRLNQFT